MDPLIALNACSGLCLCKFSHSLQEIRCNSPPQTFGITVITAVSSYLSLLLQKAGTHHQSEVTLQKRKKGQQCGCSGRAKTAAGPPCQLLWPCRSQGLTTPLAPTCSSKNSCFIPSLTPWLSQPRGTRQIQKS